LVAKGALPVKLHAVVVGALGVAGAASSFYYAKSLFIAHETEFPAVHARLWGVGYYDNAVTDTSYCNIHDLSAVVTFSRDKLTIDAKGHYEDQRATCGLKLECAEYFKPKNINDSGRSTSAFQSNAGDFQTTISCDHTEIAKLQPRLLEAELDIHSYPQLDPYSVPINAAYPLSVLSAGTDFGPNGYKRSARFQDRDVEEQRQFYIFIAAAVFATSIAACMEAITAFLK
jgi:hypothetical protein